MPKTWTEARISIAGVLLTPAQSMTVRVALTSFLSDLAEPGTVPTSSPARKIGWSSAAASVARSSRVAPRNMKRI